MTAPVVGVVGLGLIGGSVALDGLAASWRVVATDVDPAQREAAAAAGVEVVAGVEEVAAVADLVVVATPAPRVAEVLRTVDAAVDRPVVATAVASVQSPAVLGIERDALRHVRHVGGHPMTGTERSGFRAARRGMFDGSPWIVTPEPGDDVATFRSVVALALSVRAAPVVLAPTEHDRLVALLSHLPHVLAYTTYGRLLRTGAVGAEPLAGGSFRDATRVAATRPSFWAEVLHLNRDAVADLVADVRTDLAAVEALLREGAGADELEAALARGHRAVGRPRPTVPGPTRLGEGPMTAEVVAELERHTVAGLAIESLDGEAGTVSWTPL